MIFAGPKPRTEGTQAIETDQIISNVIGTLLLLRLISTKYESFIAILKNLHHSGQN